MGLRAASVRHPNAVVMAPALTEANQSQNFSLPPSSPINSVSQNGCYASNEDETSMCKANLKLKYSPRPINVTPNYSTKKVPPFSGLLQVASDPTQANIIMNTSPTSMGDQTDTMGLQKTGDQMAVLLKEKISNDVEQLLNNISADGDLPSSVVDMSGAGELPQNVEDLMQAWNSNLEAAAHVERGQGDGDTEAIFPISFDRELFSEVDMMHMCEDEGLNQSAAKENRAKELIEDLHRKQLKLERRTEFILRRIRKIQIRHMGQHVGGEVAGLYEYVHRTLKRVKETITPNELNDGIPVHSVAPRYDLLSPEFMKPIGPSEVNEFVRKLHVSTLQQSSIARQNPPVKYFGSGSLDIPYAPVRSLVGGTVSLTPGACTELERVAGTLQTELTVIESHVDSDATASSSGAESCDETQSFSNPHQSFLSISKRAAWRYANERAQVAARWTWLQAQISDLEYKIRQYNELHRQIRAGKGSVILLDSAVHPPASPSAVNGYRGQLPGATSGKSSEEAAGFANGAVSSSSSPSSSYGYSSARVRPLHRESFKKRKLLQTTGLHTVSKRASRPSNIRCGCVLPMVPCALCTGRTDPTFPRDPPEQLTVPERVALLDPGYHPVLSFPDDISQSIHLEAIMKLSDWQQKMSKGNNANKVIKGLPKGDRPEKSLMMGVDNRPKKSEHRKKYNKLLKSELKNKFNRGRRPYRSGSGNRVHKKRLNMKLSLAQMGALASESMDEMELEALGLGSLNSSAPGSFKGDSQTPSPLSHVVPYRRNRSVYSYDIDNIVIPYSVAAATRVEKLQYKEILTPKWRLIDTEFPARYDVKNNGLVRRVSEDSDNEDVSEETITYRHDKCEVDEKKKFLSYIKFPLTGGRSRANRRTDSRAESSGANTPDPMSPHTGDTLEASLGSPLTSPPATPVMVEETSQSSAVQSNQRRRTASQTRWAAHREELRCVTPEDVEIMNPYDERAFPLSEDTYDKMLKLMPQGHPLPGYTHPEDETIELQKSRDFDGVEPAFINSRAGTPVSDSTESAIAEEDPNDPEWCDVEQRIRERAKR